MVIELTKRDILRKIRENKEECDWDKWETEGDKLACTEFIDCRGCGAWEKEKEFYERTIKELIGDIKRCKQPTHVKEFMEQFDERLIFDLACYLVLKRLEECD